ncbi:MAG: hypothetical protein ACK52I_01625 [Pseudomonadota bacterium]|jgi:hypothetical protein
MSVTAALARLVDVVKATQPTAAKGLGTKFVHDDRGDASVARRFHFRVVEGFSDGAPALAVHRASVVVDLFMRYATAEKAGDLEAVIADDALTLSKALADGTQWESADSGIIYVGAESGAKLFPFVVDDDGGARRLRVRFLLQVRVS